MHKSISDFFHLFKTSFGPPKPGRGKNGDNWFVSKPWGLYVKNSWLSLNFVVTPELRIGTRLLDGALQWKDAARRSERHKFDYAAEWEWDYNKVHRDFPTGDLTKVLLVDAHCGIAIIHTRMDGNYARNGKAGQTLLRLRESVRKHRNDGRPVGVIEIRRTEHDTRHVKFVCLGYDLDEPGASAELGGFAF